MNNCICDDNNNTEKRVCSKCNKYITVVFCESIRKSICTEHGTKSRTFYPYLCCECIQVGWYIDGGDGSRPSFIRYNPNKKNES